MRQERIVQASIFDIFAEHEIGRELKLMSQWLDEQRSLLTLVIGDLRQRGVQETGRHGLPAEAVLRCALLKQYRQLSYEELAFHLEDSASFRAFARLPLGWSPKKSVLHNTISAISAASWEAINRAVVRSARHQKLDDGAMLRIDSTVTEALIHAPTDSSLLWDAVRVMVRLLTQADALQGVAPVLWRNHRRLAKKRALAIQYCRGKEQKTKLYREPDRSHPRHPGLAPAGRPSPLHLPHSRSHSLAPRGRSLPTSDRAPQSARPSVAPLPARPSRPARSWSACSRRMPTSSSRADATCITVTSSISPPAAQA